ncbi:dicarboxylate/amino acid:cation symporter [Ornithinimicrobium faecis]|uniref:Dicarboxylate/amino acid:cation symporter n=1 Tax=Ornithinimicrobium faecis TaxID=2934158 RepID=A0ABY4YVR5_9MICO|nr:cation:dicarboxylase symporter family transporter [Ornithinimicrobium sp. HY1793]USQ80463.1 dicarboxylate/amino acid:cation symporter [Ornithinimicrobium sp. HY1793]
MKFGLLPRIIVAILAGVGLGLILPDSILGITESLRVLLSGLLKFFIPLIVLAFIGAGIADFRGKVGKLLSTSVILAYVDTVIGIALAVVVAVLVIPQITSQGDPSKAGNELPEPFFEMIIDPPLAILTALLLAFILGIGATWDSSTVIRDGLLQFRDIVLWSIRAIVLPVIPFFIGLTFIKLAAEGEIFNNIPVFLGMFLLIVVMQWVWLAIEYGVAGAVSRQNPLRMIKAMIPAYFTGMGTMSSAVTMPVALKQVHSSKMIDDDVTDFAIPLFNTVHQAAAGIGIAVAAMTVSVLTTGSLPDTGSIVAFVILLAVIEVGAVGIPGGSILASLGILQSTLGFGEAELGLMLTLFAIQDSFATAGNVTGDGALTMIVNKWFGKGPGSSDTDRPAADQESADVSD